MVMNRVLTALLALILGCTPNAKRDLAGDGPARSATKSGVARGGELLFAPSRTYAVIAGVLKWPDPALAAFSDQDRKDAELHRLLKRLGVPAEHTKLLLDEQATTKAILAATRSKAGQAPKGSTLLFYFAGHGLKAKDGKAYFASYDISSSDPIGTGLSLDKLSALIAADFKGSRVVLMADCCYSGALSDVAAQLSKRGVEAMSLTSAEASNTSTKNWTFTQAIIDGLGGDPLCDADGDGRVTVGELATEVRAALLYREGQRYGFSQGAVPSKTRVADVQKGKLQPPKNRRAYVEVKTPHGWRTGRMRSDLGKKFRVRLFDYARSTDLTVGPSEIRSINFRRYDEGASIEVFWEGKIWPAKVTRADGAFHFITYPGWPSYWDEWVTSRRIVQKKHKGELALDKGTAVHAKWQGKWYPATILKRKGTQHLVHYDGYGDKWDEWLGPQRIRAR